MRGDPHNRLSPRSRLFPLLDLCARTFSLPIAVARDLLQLILIFRSMSSRAASGWLLATEPNSSIPALPPSHCPFFKFFEQLATSITVRSDLEPHSEKIFSRLPSP